jgi:hypothetical protein
MTEVTDELQEILDQEPLVEVVDKVGLKEKELEELFHKLVVNFKLRWSNKTPPTYISQAGLYNYAISIMRYEFHNRFSDEKAKQITDKYKP